MVETRYLSTAEVARALGVGVTTVKRWVDEGVLPAHRTVGGHRKVPLADVLRLVREGDLPRADLSLLTNSPAAAAGPGQFAPELFRALRKGDGQAARALIQVAYESGASVETLADEVIAPAMERVGHGWADGSLDVYQEHRGTQVCLAALLGLRSLLEPPPGRDRPLAVGGGPEGDPYLLANALAEMVLREQGWEAVNLGPNTPLPSFRKALRELRPRLLWLSCGYLADAESFLAQYGELYREAERAGVAVAVGGRALNEAVRGRMRYTTFGDGLKHLAAFARTLHPLPTRPRRGRPPGTRPR
jgi:MerR family transcriptional regulator, light-induced transcriptional regulator